MWNLLGFLGFNTQGEAEDTITKFLEDCEASLLVTDFSPLREIRKCKDEICRKVSDSVSIHEVDTHNVVPIWVASEKLEYGARTIRGKINKRLPEYLIDFPTLQPPTSKWVAATNRLVDWDVLIDNVTRLDINLLRVEVGLRFIGLWYWFCDFCMTRKGAEVPEIEWCEPGEDAAIEVLMGSKNGFLMKRLKNYATDRNNPLKPKGLSGLSPYLHFGQISAQRCALEARRVQKLSPKVCGV